MRAFRRLGRERELVEVAVWSSFGQVAVAGHDRSQDVGPDQWNRAGFAIAYGSRWA